MLSESQFRRLAESEVGLVADGVVAYMREAGGISPPLLPTDLGLRVRGLGRDLSGQ